MSNLKNHVLVGKDNIIWSIRGTDFSDAGDVKNDAHIAISTILKPESSKNQLNRVGKQLEFLNKERLKETDNIYNSLRKKYPNKKIDIYGHSLGGFLTKHVLHKNKNDENLKAYGINAAPHHSHDLMDSRYNSIRNVYDPVSVFESKKYNKNPNALTYYDYKDPYHSHLIDNWNSNFLDTKKLHQTLTYKFPKIIHGDL